MQQQANMIAMRGNYHPHQRYVNYMPPQHHQMHGTIRSAPAIYYRQPYAGGVMVDPRQRMYHPTNMENMPSGPPMWNTMVSHHMMPPGQHASMIMSGGNHPQMHG